MNTTEDNTESCRPEPLKVLSVSHIRHTLHSVHYVHMTEANADAILRGDKKDIIAKAMENYQKGDYIVILIEGDTIHEITSRVYEATFVSNFPFPCDEGPFVSVSISRMNSMTFHSGYDLEDPVVKSQIVATDCISIDGFTKVTEKAK